MDNPHTRKFSKIYELEAQGKFVEANKLRESVAKEEYSPFKDEMSEYVRVLEEFVKEKDSKLLDSEFPEVNQAFDEFLEDTFRGSEEKADIKLNKDLKKVRDTWISIVTKSEIALKAANKSYLKDIKKLLS